jgi:hypothetical protein
MLCNENNIDDEFHGSHFVPLEGKFLLYIISYYNDNITCDSTSNFDNVFATGGINIVEVFQSLTTSL